MTDHRKRDPKGRILPVSGWMPIETLPDGAQDILVWWAETRTIEMMPCDVAHDYRAGKNNVKSPTMWHELPKPPQGDAK